MDREQDSFDVMHFLNWNLPHPQPLFNPQPPHLSEFTLPMVEGNTQPTYRPSQPSNLSATLPRITKPSNSKQEGCDQLAERRAKNKIAAKQSRDRKKFYLQAIEKKTQAMQEELQKIQKELQECKLQIRDAYIIKQQNLTGSLNAQVVQVYHRLKELVAQGDKPSVNTEINFSVDSLCYRFAVLGKQRVRLINEGYSQIFRLAIPVIQRYFMWMAKKGCHYFADPNNLDEQLESWFETRPMMSDALIENQDKVKKLRETIIQQKRIFADAVTALMQKREEMTTLCGQIDELHQELRSIYTPRQMAQVILFDQTIRYKQILFYLENICDESEKQEQADKANKNQQRAGQKQQTAKQRRQAASSKQQAVKCKQQAAEQKQQTAKIKQEREEQEDLKFAYPRKMHKSESTCLIKAEHQFSN